MYKPPAFTKWLFCKSKGSRFNIGECQVWFSEGSEIGQES